MINVHKIEKVEDMVIDIFITIDEKLTLNNGYDSMQILYNVALYMHKVIMGELELTPIQYHFAE